MGGRDTSKVEGSFRQALSLAEEMSALNWRLLAAKDFTEFLRSQGRQEEGFDILSSVYNRFTEGHDCPELQKTRARLLTLGSPAL